LDGPREPNAAQPRVCWRRRRCVTSAAATLAWTLGFIVLGQVAILAILEYYPRFLRDPEYGLKAAYLRQQQARHPGRPLVVVLGSSRTSLGIRPDALPAWDPAYGPQPLVFNFSMLGSGPLMELMCLNRLLADGIRPDVVFVEYWPPVLKQDDGCAEEGRIDLGRLSWGDLPLLARYWSDPRKLRRGLLEERVEPFFSYRFSIMSRLAPAWLPMAVRRGNPWPTMDHFGWLPNPHEPITTAAEHDWRMKSVRDFYRPILERFRISDLSDRALRELFAVCRREGIGVVLFQMPEGSEFRALYPAAVMAEADAYLARLAAEFHLPVVNARRWVPDQDFSDSFHLLPDAAAAFSHRFGIVAFPLIREALQARVAPGQDRHARR
jgi:hypothetical protein